MGGIYISHMRDEASGVLDSVRETIAIGEQGGLPTQVTHHKIVGKANWGQSVDTLQLVDEARARGVDATIDQYPVHRVGTSISAALLPAWALEGGRERRWQRLEDPATRAKIKAESVAHHPRRARRRRSEERRQLAQLRVRSHRSPARTSRDVTRSRGLPATIENAAETAMWIVEQGGCQGIFHAIGEEDLERILRHPATMIASDGEVPIFGRGVPHPRSYGTFARVLGRLRARAEAAHARGRRAEDVGVPRAAARPGRSRRPAAGLKADIAVFDPARVARHRDVREAAPVRRRRLARHRQRRGRLRERQAMTPARPGRVLYGPARK